MLLLLLVSILAVASAQRSATVELNFGKNFPCNGTHIKGVEVNLCPELTTSFTTLTQQYTVAPNGDKIVSLQTPGLNQEQECTVTVRESVLVVKRSFLMFADQTYEWNDLTSDLTVHIEWWNPWCALSPIDNCNEQVYNGGRVTLQARMPQGPDEPRPMTFRQYSDKPAVCGDLQLSWDYFPHLANGNYFGEGSCDETNGAFTEAKVVGILNTDMPITVYAEEYRNGNIVQQSDCDPQAWTLGHDGVIYPPNEAPQVPISLDTDCSDRSCDSGVLISRLQVPNLCTEPNPDNREKLGQPVFANDEQFPVTSLLMTFRTGTSLIQTFPYRWFGGRANSRIDFYVIASNSYEVGAQYPAASCPTTTLTTGSLVKVPVASCRGGSCEAQPITSTLYLDTQGHCEDIRDVSIRQQSYSQQGTTVLFSNYRPNCINETQDQNRLLFCVFNLRNTEITVEYNLFGTANTVDVALPTIDCQNTPISQRCDSVGGQAMLCPDWGCIVEGDGNGPTQINMAVTTYRPGDAAGYVLNYQVAAPGDLQAHHDGCLWIPAVGELNITVSEGCCEYPVASGLNAGGFTGCGCVQATINTTACLPGGNCTTNGSFGRLLTVFDLAYLPEDPGVQTTSVSLEAPSDTSPCCPFRFKTQEGGAPRCYCVLPVELKARIIETHLDTRAQACKCTNVESCVVKYTPEREADCGICDFLSAFHFDLTGLPRWTTAQLYVGPYDTTTADPAMKLLRDYPMGVGGVNNWKSVLRTGDQDQAPCCENQTYCLVVEENAASLERCISCVGKICEPKAFTRQLCLNLESPCPDGTISNLLDVSLFVQSAGPVSWPFSEEAPTRHNNDPTQWVRTVRNQGGVNGCEPSVAAKKKSVEELPPVADVADAEVLLSMTEEELIDYEAAQAQAFRQRDERERNHYLMTANSGQYTVLAIPYVVGVFEGNARVYQETNCMHPMMDPTAYCNASDFINCMCWNTTCAGHAIGANGENGGGIPSDNLWVTLGTQDLEEPIVMGSQEWRQIRGPRGYWSQNLTTCDWSRATWINATWTAAGNQYQCVPVLAFNRLALRVEEGLILPPAPIWPDPRGHPTVTVEVNCSYRYDIIPSGQYAGYKCRQSNLKTDCYCRVEPPQIFSLWEIISVRGMPSQGNQLVFKYTRPDQQQLSNQGVFRNVPGSKLAVGSGLETDVSTWRPAENYFCMVADPLYAFSFNWGDYAYPYAHGELAPSPNALITNFNCDADVKPYANQLYDFQEGLNMCRGCGKANVDNGVLQKNPCLYTSPPTVVDRVCNTTASLSPASSYDQGTPDTITEDNSKLCRVAWVLTGSDNPADLPLGQIFVIPFY